MEIIKTENLTYTYPIGEKPAFSNVSITINKGEFVLLTGPSGCGKTTLCRCFNGLIPHFYNGTLEGKITVAGMDVTEHPIHEFAQHVGLVFQNPENQLFALSVEKDVAFALENLGLPREEIRRRVDWALEVTGITDLKDRAPYELSGGQQQRVAIASVLAMKPDVIVLDEPTSFLDPLSAKKIFDVIGGLNRGLGITIILVEHRLDLAARYADRIIVMDEGKIILDGKPREVFSSEEARLVGVGIPRATRLYQVLKGMGLDLGGVPITSEEASKMVREVLTRRAPSKNPLGRREAGTQVLPAGKAGSKTVIEVEDVYYTYPNGVEALRGVSLRVREGEFVAIMGQNGAGKTTLVKHFNGLLKPTRGRVLIDGVETRGVSVARLARKVGFVFQNPDHQLFCETVEKEVAFALKNFGFDEETTRKRVDWALNILDLTEYRDVSPFMLSGGERKRVALASVLAWDPEVLILDEPTIGQDYRQKERLMNFIMQLNAQGKTVIIVTHDVEFVAECKPRVILMAEGKILADGDPHKVLTDLNLLERASLTPPEASQILEGLKDVGLDGEAIDVYEVSRLIMERFKSASGVENP
ncbi:MAG: ABC transporter [Candidatus Bathyarchaeota archaeon B26-1]|nr:MAG: ABC transporter [Candidatus Bathyarchaeota archaeon B26-1]